jgi:hypothetical protein
MKMNFSVVDYARIIALLPIQFFDGISVLAIIIIVIKIILLLTFTCSLSCPENCRDGELPGYSPSHPKFVNFKIKKNLTNAVLIKSSPSCSDKKKRFETFKTFQNGL